MKRLIALVLMLSLVLSVLVSCASPQLSQLENESETQTQSQLTTEKETDPQSDAPEATAEKEQKDPSEDLFLNVLIIGNSFSTGWPDELNGLLKAAGIQANIYTVYYSGCPIKDHWYWLKGRQMNYRLRHHIQNGGVDDDQEVGLEFCLKKKNWDVISLQQHFGPTIASSYEASLESCTPFAQNLFDYLKEKFPKTKLVWHQTWAYEVEGVRPDQKKGVADVATQTLHHENIRAVSQKIATDNGVALIPCGDAFQIARQNGAGDLSRDGYHDGIETGGQYLNACTWFESLTGQSCIGNTWRPKYSIAEERILQLQQYAHQAVEENTIK